MSNKDKGFIGISFIHILEANKIDYLQVQVNNLKKILLFLQTLFY